MFGEQHEVLLLGAFVVLAAVWIMAQLVLLRFKNKRWLDYGVTVVYGVLGMLIVTILLWPSDWSNRNQLFTFAAVSVAFGFCVVGLGPLYLRSYRRYFRTKMGLCLQCGYDLRASKERCPECGTPVPTKVEAKA